MNYLPCGCRDSVRTMATMVRDGRKGVGHYAQDGDFMGPCETTKIAMSWEDYFLKLAETVSLKSKDPVTKVGAVIVGPDNEIRSTGYNGFPRGIVDDPDRWNDRQEKYNFVEHAERNAIYNAARIGTSTNGCEIFMTGPPCLECARAIIQAGIRAVYYPKEHAFKHRKDWEASMLRAKNLLNEAFVSVCEQEVQ